MNFYEKNQDIIGQLSSKYRLERDVVEALISHTFLSIRECISMDDMPNILLHNWGRFSARATTLEKRILNFQNMIDRDVTLLTKERAFRLRKYILAYIRVCEETKRTPIEGLENLLNIVNSKSDEEE